MEFVAHTLPLADMSSGCEDMSGGCDMGSKRLYSTRPSVARILFVGQGDRAVPDAQTYQTQRVCPYCGWAGTAERTVCEQCGQLAVLRTTRTIEGRGTAVPTRRPS
jgi:hypothetical protein